MAIMRARSSLVTAAPPPSPIPTAKGSRSASNETFTQFLDKCLQIPELIALPPSLISAAAARHHVPADIDFRSLSAESITRLLVSAKQFGAFRITNHGISADELGSVVREAESLFGKRFVERNVNREEIKWGPQVLQDQKYRDFCQNMEKISSKVEAIAEQLSQVFFGKTENQLGKIESELGKVRLFRYNHQDHSMEQSNNYLHNEILNGNINIPMRECEDHALCLHLPLEHSQFNIQSDPGLSFDAGPENLVVTVGNQLQGFKCVSGEMMIFVPDISTSQASFSIQLKVQFSDPRKKSKAISIADQIRIALILWLLYNIVVFVYTHTTT